MNQITCKKNNTHPKWINTINNSTVEIKLQSHVVSDPVVDDDAPLLSSATMDVHTVNTS